MNRNHAMEYILHALLGTGCHDINRVKLLTKASAVILGDKIILPFIKCPNVWTNKNRECAFDKTDTRVYKQQIIFLF